MFILFLVFLLPAGLRAEEAAVGRDGTLVFQSPDGSSAVLDILPRGTRLELVKRGEEWSEVMLPESNTRGFVRTSALQLSAMAAAQEGKALLSGPASPLYNTLQEELNKSDAKIRRIEQAVSHLEGMVDKYTQADSAMHGKRGAKGKALRSQEFPEAGGSWAGYRGFDLFSGMYTKEKDLTIGGAVSWFPESMSGFGLELEAGYLFLEGDRRGAGLSLDLLYPLGWSRPWLMPYLCAGGGLFYLSGVDGAGSETNPSANLGAGALCPLSSGFSLRPDLRLFASFNDGERNIDGRFFLALHRGF
ncbi:MAG: hypothetical protein JXQ83_07395 [Candidatus Glassbacteria bacterium]|nr:hypothetical protein [Candidatus Glassbacteria bacterium]